MQAHRFAITKIQPPRSRSHRVERRVLNAALARALGDQRVVLLQAPAGFGKTALLAGHLPLLSAGTALAWISLDEDDDAQRVFACLVAALEPHDLPWRTAPEALVALIGDDAAKTRRALDELLNALAGADAARGVIVFDDLHRVQSEPAHALIEALIERLPAQWTIVLSTRVQPAQSLARWRAAGELTEFNQDDLRFSAEEAASLAQNEALAPDAGRIAELFERTQGWPAGLQLCIAALRTRPAATGALASRQRGLLDRHLFDYLASEVLDDMPPELRDFLTRTSVLPELTAQRAAAVSGDAHAAQWLDEIERRGLFVTVLDAQERTLVLHDLFRNALDERLLREHRDELPELLRRAAAGETDPLRRVGFLLRASDWPAAEAALDAAAPELLLQGGVGEVQRLVANFPAAWRASSARLLRVDGVAQCLRWQWAEMAASMQGAAAAARAAGDDAELRVAQAYLASALYPLGRNDEAEALLAELDALPLPPRTRALALMGECSQRFRRGEHDRVPEAYARIVETLEREASLFTWWECAPASNWSTLRGMRPVLQRYFTGALVRIGERAIPMRAEVQVQRAFVALWSGEFDTAQELAASAADDLKWLACSGEMEVALQLFGMISDAIRGRAQPVWARLEALFIREDQGTDERRRLWHHQMGVYGLRLNDVLGGDPAQARRWAGYLLERPLETDSAAPRARLARARHAAAEGRWADAAEGFVSLVPRATQMDVMGQSNEIHLRAAHALLRCGRLADAAQAAAPALDRMRIEGERGHALMCGPGVLRTLADAPWDDLLEPSQRAELEAAAALANTLRESDAAAAARATDGQAVGIGIGVGGVGGAAGAAGGTEPAHIARGGSTGEAALLSVREREVLELIAAGDSNKVIARSLDISPHTVKRHVANILDKIGAASRGQASAWLRANA